MQRCDHWIVPEWAAPSGVNAVCSTRAGGFSRPPFDSLNLGDHVRDEPAHVRANRERLGERLAPNRPVFLQQVHGTAVVRLDRTTADGTQADGCVTMAGSGAAATIMVADCLPVLFALASGEAVAAAHAGWRGLANGVLENTVKALRRGTGASSNQVPVVAWLGPCIGPAAFEVGAEVRAAFLVQCSQASRAATENCFVPTSAGKYRADLPALARLRLLAIGVTAVGGNDGSPAWCTFSQSSVFFSHRRDAARLGSTGRMAASVWIA
ncbi:MAG: peptidoglycan editing factor PgeF [Hydrogenophaga sp.]